MTAKGMKRLVLLSSFGIGEDFVPFSSIKVLGPAETGIPVSTIIASNVFKPQAVKGHICEQVHPLCMPMPHVTCGMSMQAYSFTELCALLVAQLSHVEVYLHATRCVRVYYSVSTTRHSHISTSSTTVGAVCNV